MTDKAFLIFVCIMAILAIAVVSLMAIGKYQLCKNYYPEMTTVACYFTQLPGVPPKSSR